MLVFCLRLPQFTVSFPHVRKARKMLRLFSKNIKPTNYRRTLCSNLSNPQLYARNKFSEKPVSSHLELLLSKYFHPYQFFISADRLAIHPVQDFSTVLFNVNQIENTNGLNYKVTANFDPVIKFISKILDKDLETGFKIDSGLFLPRLLPLHFSLRIRDAIEKQQIRTYVNDLPLGQDPLQKLCSEIC